MLNTIHHHACNHHDFNWDRQLTSLTLHKFIWPLLYVTFSYDSADGGPAPIAFYRVPLIESMLLNRKNGEKSPFALVLPFLLHHLFGLFGWLY